MAIVSNPLLSFAAHGKFAEQFTFVRTAAFQHARKFSKPTGQASPAQVKSRENMSAVSNNWNDLFSSAQNLTAWKLYAHERDRTLTAANCFIRSALRLTPENQAPAFVLAAYGVGRVLVLKMLEAFAGAIAIETGSFLAARGENAEDLIFKKAIAIDTGSIIGPVAPIGGTYFYQVYKDDVPRSGIIELTQTQAATYNQAEAAGLTYDQLLNAGITWDDLI